MPKRRKILILGTVSNACIARMILEAGGFRPGTWVIVEAVEYDAAARIFDDDEAFVAQIHADADIRHRGLTVKETSNGRVMFCFIAMDLTEIPEMLQWQLSRSRT